MDDDQENQAKLDKKCGPGMIQRKGYYRNRYNKTTDEYDRTYVAPKCIRDVGKPGHGPKTLPRPDNKLHVSEYGWHANAATNVRHAALDEAVEDYGILPVERHLNLLRNYQSNPDVKKIFSEDVDYLKEMYRESKQLGGTDDFVLVDEVHNVNGMKVEFRSLNDTDADQAAELDGSKKSGSEMLSTIREYPGRLIGVWIDDVLSAWCLFDLVDSSEPKSVEIIRFVARQGNASTLYVFLERFWMSLNCDSIRVPFYIGMQNGKEGTRWMNFWISNGFIVSDISGDIINFHKYI